MISEKVARGDGDYRVLDGLGGVDAGGSHMAVDWVGYMTGSPPAPSSTVGFASLDWVGYRVGAAGIPPAAEPSMLSTMRMIRTIMPMANGHVVLLPDARNVDFLGYPVMVVLNVSPTYSFDILSNDANTLIVSVPPNTAYKLGLFDRSTANGEWYARARPILGRGTA